jgi:hypothetical protein
MTRLQSASILVASVAAIIVGVLALVGVNIGSRGRTTA